MLSRLLLISALLLPALATACASDPDSSANDDDITSVNASEVDAAQRTSLDGFRYESLTPTSQKMMRAARYWMTKQSGFPAYPKPRMCANNVSRVLFLAGVTDFDQEGVRNLINDVDGAGGDVLKLPQDEAGFVRKLNTLAGGKLPAGTLVAGMSVTSSNPGDQHVGMVGHTDPDGTVWLYQNNWYRPANENGQRKPFMVSDENLRRGFERQWMATPWLKLTRDASGKITHAKALMPGLDDMDPFNPGYQATVAIIPQVVSELAAGQTISGDAPAFETRTCEVSSSDGFGNVRAEARSSSQLLGSLTNGNTVTVKAKMGEWYKVEAALNGRTTPGFMHQSLLTKAPCGANP